MGRRTNRRQFLHGAAATGIGFWVAGGVTSARADKSDKLRIACIGVGGKGDSDIEQAGVVGDIVAICDIDENTLNRKAAKFPKAKKYFDYREMLTEMDKGIDAVTVSGPDHMHAHASLTAMKLKKHVYCQKPLTHDVFEARQVREAARKYGVCTQMGNQGSASDGSAYNRRISSTRACSARSPRRMSGPTGRANTGSRPPMSSPAPLPPRCPGTSTGTCS